MKSTREIEQTLRDIIGGPDDDDPMLRQMFRGLADRLAPSLARLAASLAPPRPEPLPAPPATVREGKQRARKAARELKQLEKAVVRREYQRRDDVIASIERATVACCEHIRQGVREWRQRQARGEFADEDTGLAFLDNVMEGAIKTLTDLGPGGAAAGASHAPPARRSRKEK